MTCRRPLAALLRADVAELRGTANTDLGRHIRDCPRYRAVAEKVLAANDALDGVFDQPPAVDAGALLAKAQSTTADSMPHAVQRPRKRWRTLPVRWAAAGAGLAAAAGLTFAFVGSGQDAMPGTLWTPQVAQPPLVESPAMAATVIQTDNPDITILWFFRGEEQ